jgi:hypothetical protein
MGIRKYVFASRAERNSYEKLARSWGKSHEIESNLPFLNVFLIDDLNLSDEDAERLKKTSIDFTLCNKDYNPILSIEFDGLYDGVNIGPDYFPSRNTRGNWRRKIMKLKIAVAQKSQFPFFVVGSEHFSDLSPELKFTIVDGIIGDVLAHKAFQEKIASGFDPEEMGYTPEDFSGFTSEDKHRIVQDWVTGIEVQSEMDNNPIRRLAAKLAHALDAVFSFEGKYFPELQGEPATIERAKEMEAALYVGAFVSTHTTDFGELSETVMLPNFKSCGFGFGFGLASTIAELVCLSRLAKMRGVALESFDQGHGETGGATTHG